MFPTRFSFAGKEQTGAEKLREHSDGGLGILDCRCARISRCRNRCTGIIATHELRR
jgi:hypothetical protein